MQPFPSTDFDFVTAHQHNSLEVLYDEDNKAYSLAPSFTQLPKVVNLPDVPGNPPVRLIRVGRPFVRTVSAKDKEKFQSVGRTKNLEEDFPPRSVFTEEEQTTLTQFLALHGFAPVFLPEELLISERRTKVEDAIFSLFHYVLDTDEILDLGQDEWDLYEKMQEEYAKVVLQLMENEQSEHIWVNDFALMLLPAMIKKHKPDVFVGFFLHCVFPSSEVYRIFPFRGKLLKGVLAADLIGFYNFQYIRHFQTACSRVLGVECSRNTVEVSPDSLGADTKLVAIPLGIDPEAYEATLKKEECIARIKYLKEKFADRKVILGVDLLEERKGIPHKLLAYSIFLQTHPEWAEKVVFIQVGSFFGVVFPREWECEWWRPCFREGCIFDFAPAVLQKYGILDGRGFVCCVGTVARMSFADIGPIIRKPGACVNRRLLAASMNSTSTPSPSLHKQSISSSAWFGPLESGRVRGRRRPFKTAWRRWPSRRPRRSWRRWPCSRRPYRIPLLVERSTIERRKIGVPVGLSFAPRRREWSRPPRREFSSRSRILHIFFTNNG